MPCETLRGFGRAFLITGCSVKDCSLTHAAGYMRNGNQCNGGDDVEYTEMTGTVEHEQNYKEDGKV